ncbi:MAG: J domain-containing protein [Bacteroidota bacterium]|jgi:curved DNA-binding protein
MEFKDYYKILGVEKTATSEQIKSAYRKLALQYHPDKNKGNKTSENKIKEINEAYEVLKNPEKRKKYDNINSNYSRYRQTGNQQDFDWSQWVNQSQPQSGRTGRKSKFSNSGNFFESGGGMSDFFEKIFGGGYSQKTANRDVPAMEENLSAVLELTLEEAFHGTTKLLSVDGRKIEIKIKPGIADGQTLRISGRGAGLNSGDLLLKISILPHKKVERKGDDLYIDLPVDLYKALLGANSRLKTFGGMLSIKISPETQNGQVLKLKGQGMPHHNNPETKGDLFVKILVKLPKNLTDEEKELFRKLQELRKEF